MLQDEQTPDTVIIRDGRPADTEHIVEFQIEMARETEGLNLQRATVTAGVQAVFEDPAKGAYLIAEVDGRIAGALLILPEWSDWRNGTVLWIHSLYVIPEARQRGVFRKLYATLQSRVKQSPELKGIRLYVDKDNHVAQNVYQALGMTGEHYQLYEWMEVF